MLTLLTSLALAGSTRILPDDDAVIAWIAQGDRSARTELPVIGPNTMRRFQDRVQGDVRFVYIPSSVDPDAAAIDARLDRGSPCALVLARAEEGWIGRMSGVCGMLSATGWRVEGERVLDGRGQPVPVGTFATSSGDPEVYRDWRRLDRARGRAVWSGIVGSGVLFASSLDLAANPDRARSRYLQVGGAAVTLGAVVAFGVVQANPRSRTYRVGAHYTEEQMRERVRAHNRRLKIAVHPGGIVGRFM